MRSSLVPLSLFVVAVAPAASVLGQVGKATAATTIRRAPNSRSAAYFRLPAFQTVIVRGRARNGWLPVLMSNRAEGYVLATKVALLPYQVVMKTGGGGLGTRAMGSEESRQAVARKGLDYLNTPYVWGGNSLTGGIDCSGFVKQLYGGIGVSLPRTAAEQALVGQPITRLENLRPGDRLYFWENKRGKIGHTGLYLGDGWFVHSSSGHRGVATDYLSARWRRILVSARR